MSYNFDTLKVHAAYNSREHQDAAQVPIYPTASFDLESTARATRLAGFTEAGNLYTRVGNPTVKVFEERVAALDGAPAALAVASGMAAVSTVILNVASNAEGRSTVLASPYIYGGSFDSFSRIYKPLGIDIKLTADVYDTAKLDAALAADPAVKAVFIESISNPLGLISDIAAIADTAHKHGVPLIVDNTIATPYLIQPVKHGADIVIYSATKALSGHGSLIGGVIADGGKFKWRAEKHPQFFTKEWTLRDRETNTPFTTYEKFGDLAFILRARIVWLNYFGAALSPFDAFLAITGVETLSERVKKQSENANALIRYLEGHSKVEWVSHPNAGATSAEQKALAGKYLPKNDKGDILAAGLFSFGFNGTTEERNKFLDSLKLLKYQANIGDSRSLIIDPPGITHGELTPDNQKFAKIPPNTVRISAGIEDVRDIIADLEQGFSASAL